MSLRILVAVYLAAITGWFWRIGLENWPAWQPPMFLAGMVILTLLYEWASRARRRGSEVDRT